MPLSKQTRAAVGVRAFFQMGLGFPSIERRLQTLWEALKSSTVSQRAGSTSAKGYNTSPIFTSQSAHIHLFMLLGRGWGFPQIPRGNGNPGNNSMLCACPKRENLTLFSVQST